MDFFASTFPKSFGEILISNEVNNLVRQLFHIVGVNDKTIFAIAHNLT